MMHLLAASPPFQTAHRQGSGWGATSVMKLDRGSSEERQ
jgi:hypothetical protein